MARTSRRRDTAQLGWRPKVSTTNRARSRFAATERAAGACGGRTFNTSVHLLPSVACFLRFQAADSRRRSRHPGRPGCVRRHEPRCTGHVPRVYWSAVRTALSRPTGGSVYEPDLYSQVRAAPELGYPCLRLHLLEDVQDPEPSCDPDVSVRPVMPRRTSPPFHDAYSRGVAAVTAQLTQPHGSVAAPTRFGEEPFMAQNTSMPSDLRRWATSHQPPATSHQPPATCPERTTSRTCPGPGAVPWSGAWAQALTRSS